MNILDRLADDAVILMFLGAVTAYLRYQGRFYARRLDLIRHLRRKRQEADAYNKSLKPGEILKQGSQSFVDITRHVQLTEDEVIRMCFRSETLQFLEHTGPTSRLSDQLVVVYVDKDLPVIPPGAKAPSLP